VERYQQDGESGLQDRPRSGRPRKADAVARSALCQAVAQAPAQLGYRFGYWTTGTLGAHLAQGLGICLSAATVRRLLRTGGVELQNRQADNRADEELAPANGKMGFRWN
jgi:transposase